jgi:hypothetical protein
MQLDINEADAALFRACTTTVLGNGNSTKFWTDRWLQGHSPKEISPNIYKLAWRKNCTVAQGLPAGKWKQGLQRIETSEQIAEYISLWNMVAQVHRTETPDKITWQFTGNGIYSGRSAYRVQFIGSFADHEWSKLWQSKVENKCKFFSWLLLQNKLWTADRIIRHRGQANTVCQLCRTQPESAFHILAQCSFTRQIWVQLADWIGITLQTPQQANYRRLKGWWHSMIQTGANEAKEREQKFIYTIWNIWKERCRRMYDNRAMTQIQLQSTIQLDVAQYAMAWRERLYSENN